MRRLDLIIEGSSYIPSLKEDTLNVHYDSRNPLSYNGSGTLVNDLSPNGNNGTLINGVSYDPVDKSFLLASSNSQYIDTGIIRDLTGVDATMTILFKPDWIGAMMLFSSYFRSGSQIHPSFNAQMNEPDNPLAFIRRDNSNANRLVSSITGNNLSDGNYHTVTLRKQDDDKYSMFVDGLLVWSETQLLTPINPNVNMLIGILPGFLQSSFNGKIYSFLDYTSFLTDEEVLDNSCNLRGISKGDPNDIKTFDLYEDEPISVIKRSTTVKDLTDRNSGTTNSFKLPTTPNNNNILDFLDLNGNTSQFPYQNNYVRYIEDGIEIIPKGRMNVKSVDSEGYDIDIAHGLNDFFDLIRGKFLHEAYEPYRVTLQTMDYTNSVLTNDTMVRDNEGYVVPLMDLGFVDPIPDYQQTVAYFLKFGLEKICEHVGYELGTVDVDLTDYVFTHDKAPSFDIVTNNRYSTGLLSSINNTAFKGGDVRLFSSVLSSKSIVRFDEISLFTSTPTSATFNPELEIRVNGVVIDSVTVTPTGTTVPVSFTHTFNSSPTYYEQGDLVEVYLTSADYTGTDELTVQYFTTASFISDFKVFHENILLDYTQTDFIKNILQIFNLGVDIDFINKKIDLYSKNDVFDNDGFAVDLSKYFSSVISKDFESEYGLNNFFKYKYQDGQNSFADGFITANNINEDTTLIESNITASSNDTLIDLGGQDVYLTTANAYESKSTNSKTNTIGFRINKVARFEDVDVDYQDKTNVVTTVNSDQTTLTFSGLDWATNIENNYSNLRDNILNRFCRYKVLMRVPSYIIRGFSFKDKVFIDTLGHNFVVEEIRTMGDGLSEWTLIRINN